MQRLHVFQLQEQHQDRRHAGGSLVRPSCEEYVTPLCSSHYPLRQPAHSSHTFSFSAVFEEEEDPTNRSFFSEIISSISDVKFSHDGRYILSRDYLSLKIWDVNMDSKPVKTIPIHDHLRGKLCDLYENDCIFDKFECIWGGDDRYVLDFEFHLHMLRPLTLVGCARH